MIDKALIIIITMYALGLMMVGLESTLLQVYHVEMISPLTGEPVKGAVEGYLQMSEFNARSANIASADFTTNSTFYDRVETFTTGAAFIAWELVTLMSGTYIFHIMILFGIPQWFVTAFIILYILLLARAIIGYVRGI